MEAIEVGGLVVHRDAVSHPLLGRAHVIEHAGRPITAMSEIDWERPAQIPTIAEPRALPPGSGTLLMNELALRAKVAGVAVLRYAGPYPTHALYESLKRSFRPSSDVDEFTADVLDRAVRLARDEIPVDFAPAPFSREPTSYGFLDRRDGEIDRVSIDNVMFDREGAYLSLAQLARADDGWLAHLKVGERTSYARIARLAADGALVDGPHPIPATTFEIAGQDFPAPLREQLAGIAHMFAPPVLVDDVARAIRDRRTAWADLGWRSARKTVDGFELHAAIFGAPRSELLVEISYHLVMIAQSAVLDELLASRRR